MNKEEIWCRKFKINSLNQAILFHWIAVAVILHFEDSAQKKNHIRVKRQREMWASKTCRRKSEIRQGSKQELCRSVNPRTARKSRSRKGERRARDSRELWEIDRVRVVGAENPNFRERDRKVARAVKIEIERERAGQKNRSWPVRIADEREGQKCKMWYSGIPTKPAYFIFVYCGPIYMHVCIYVMHAWLIFIKIINK